MSLIKKLLPRSLLGRSLMILVVPLILLQIITTYIFFERHWQTVSRRLSESFAGEIAMIIDVMPRLPQGQAENWAFTTALGLLNIETRFAPGETLSKNPSHETGLLIDATLAKALDQRLPYPYQIDSTSVEDYVEVQIQLPEGVLYTGTNRKRLFTSTTYIFILWMVGTSLVLFAVATIFMRNQVKPIRRLAEAADSFGKGRDVPRFKPEGAAEVRMAAAAFQLMRSRIQRQIAQRTEMLAGVSHDLGTVLTRMKLELALLKETRETELLARDVAEMQHMIEGYLDFARGEGPEPNQPTDLDSLLVDVAENFRRKGGEVILEAQSGLILPLRPSAFRRAIGNLLENTGRYAKKARIEVRSGDNAAEIILDDDGPGIPEEAREDVFKPFYRIDNSRNLETGGVGLGLSIAQDIILRHGGTIGLDSAPMGGLRVMIRLPL